MNIAVLVKSAVDEAELRSDAGGSAQLSGAQAKISTFDKNAVEAALSLREAKGGSVTVVSLGSQDSRKAIKEAVAMGCDKATLILSEGGHDDALSTSYYLAAQIKRMAVDLVLCSEGASDTYQGQVGAMLAELLGLPFVACARKVEEVGGRIRAEQALEDGTRVCEAALPCVVSVVSEANEPRYPTLLQIMQASKKPVEEVPLSSLRGPDLPATAVEVLGVFGQSVARKQVIFEGAPEETARKLVEALRKEGAI